MKPVKDYISFNITGKLLQASSPLKIYILR